MDLPETICFKCMRVLPGDLFVDKFGNSYDKCPRCLVKSPEFKTKMAKKIQDAWRGHKYGCTMCKKHKPVPHVFTDRMLCETCYICSFKWGDDEPVSDPVPEYMNGVARYDDDYWWWL